MKQTFSECMDLAEASGAKSIAFSLFTNHQMFDLYSNYEFILQVIVKVVATYNLFDPGIEQVLFVTHMPRLVRELTTELHTQLSKKGTFRPIYFVEFCC